MEPVGTPKLSLMLLSSEKMVFRAPFWKPGLKVSSSSIPDIVALCSDFLDFLASQISRTEPRVGSWYQPSL